VPGTVLGALFLRIVIDGVAKIIKTGADVYEGLIVGVVVVFAVAFSQTEGRRQRTPFFAGGLGFVAGINLALIAGVMATLVGPTLLEGKTSLEGAFLGLWTAVSVVLLLVFMRSNLRGVARRLIAVGLAIVAIGLFWGLDRGVPAYRAYAANSLVHSLGGRVATDSHNDRHIDLSGTRLNNDQLKQVIERLRSIRNVTELSLARTQITDQGFPFLKPLTTLKRIDLSGTNVSRVGKTMLQRSLPDAEIVD